MKKSVVLISLILGLLAIALTGSLAQETTDANWCFEGGPWGDGRCNNDDPFLNNYNWVAGWCKAQIESGNLDMSFEDCIGEEQVAEEDDSVRRQANNDTYNVGCDEVFELGAPGVLKNDDGKDLKVLSHSDPTPSAAINSFELNANGSLRVTFNDPGTFTFTYKINGGSSAKVTLINECKEPG